MGFIKDILKRKEEKEQEKALKYLYNRLKIGTHRNMSMQEYFDKRYRANCYYYSTYILLCLKPTDRLVRGSIHIDGELDFIYKSFCKGLCPNYAHAWVEFEFNDKWWVYDDHYTYPIQMDLYYEMKKPYKIDKKFTQTELIKYIKEKYSDKIKETKQGETTYISTECINISKYCIPFEWVDLELKNGEIVKFEQDKDMKACLC